MKKLKNNTTNDSWVLAEDIPDIDFFFCQIWLSSFVNNLKNACGKNYSKTLGVFNGYHLNFYFGEKDSLNFEKYLINKLEKNYTFGDLINKNIIKWSDELRKFSSKLENLKLKNLSNKDLLSLIIQQDKIHTKLYEWGWLSNATDMFHGSFTSHLKNYLTKKLNNTKDVNKIFNALTMPETKSVTAIEEESLFKIALNAENNNGQINKKLLQTHFKNYFYLKHQWLGTNGIYSIDYFASEIKKILRDKISPKEKLKLNNLEILKNKKCKKGLFKKLKIETKWQNLFKIYSEFMTTKIYRRYSQIYWAYTIQNLLKEIGKRLKLSLDEVRFLLPNEFPDALLKNNTNRKEIAKRTKFCFYYATNENAIISTNKKASLLNGLSRKIDKDIKELTGQIGCLGKAKGKVKIINSPKDMGKINKGDILVSIATNPDIVPAMKKAAAIITEQGGVTCHAAIVSREMKKPCIIGTKIATQVLKDGDLVEVDANKGVVKIIK